jgi:HK97 family phage major capsid protein
VTLTSEERAAMAVGTNTAGGYLVPTHLDPTLLLTNSGSSNVMRQHAKVVTLTEGSVWHGVTTAGVTASWDGELVEVSDDTPPSPPPVDHAYKAQSLVAASVDAFQDIAGLTQDVLELFADAKDRLEGAAHMTGSGSQPQGLFTVINASSSLQTTSTTAATLGEVDIHALYRALPVRWRSKGSFVLNPLYNLAIKRLGTAVSSSFSGDLTQPVTDRILGRPVVETDDAPTTQTTTVLDQEVVFADLSNFVIVDKPGAPAIEFIPHLFNTQTTCPTVGARGSCGGGRVGHAEPGRRPHPRGQDLGLIYLSGGACHSQLIHFT